MGKYRRYKNIMEMFLSSEKGKRLLNFLYSWGASIVVLGALFKLLHLPYANQILFVAMITESIVFFISAFERPSNEYHWEDVFPILKSKNPMDRPDFQSGKGIQTNAANGAAPAFNPGWNMAGGVSGGQVGAEGTINIAGSVNVTEEDTKNLSESIKKLSGAASVPFVVINSGARGERYLQAHFSSLPPQAFVQYGNFVGETLRVASEMGVRSLRLGIMVGKAVKLAEGHLDTHSHKVVFNRVFLSDLAKESGCSSAAIALIGRMTLARELWKELDAADRDRFFPRLLSSCLSVVAPFFPGSLSILLLDEMGEIRYTVSK